MATISRPSVPHEDRTAAEPRENTLEPVILSNIRQLNDSIRLLRLSAVDPNHNIELLPGQWLDTFIPGLPKAGGFTITSTPSEARPSQHWPPYLELAVQRSSNPPAKWLWRPESEILNSQLLVRVGGSFVWPPTGIDEAKFDRLVLVAGGVGINPLISIFSHLIRTSTATGAGRPREIHFIYGTKATYSAIDEPSRILFLPRLLDLAAAAADQANVTLTLFLTGLGDGDQGPIEHGKLPNRTFGRKMKEQDLVKALDGYGKNMYGAQGREGTVCFVCGPPRMTDEFVGFLGKQDGITPERVRCEKWW